ncbi:MAG: PAS domain-containing protein [Burkholderiaceae bacterium]|nr:PAS domain-containing protein [Burkholderiaceae bacterium]
MLPLPLDPDPQAPATAEAFVAAFQWVDTPIAWTDAAGRLLGANPAFEAALAAPLAALRGRSMGPLLGLRRDTDPALVAALERGDEFTPTALAGRRADGQPLHGRLGQRRAGALRILSLQLAPAEAPAAADEDTAPSAAKLLEMAQSLGRFGVWQHDLRTGASHWDPQVWQYFGLAPRNGALDFAALLQTVHPDDHAAVVGGYLASLKQPGRHGHRYRLRGGDGRYRAVRAAWEVRPGADGRPAQVWGLLLDDSEATRLAQSFDDTTARLNLAITLAGVAIWQHDQATDRVQANDLGWSLLGLASRPQGRPAATLKALLHPDDLAALAQPHQRVPRTRPGAAGGMSEGAIDFGARWRHADGSWRYLLTRRVPQRDARGQLLGHVGVALDLSEGFDQQQRALALARRLEMVTAAAGVGVWDVLLADPPLVYFDEQMRALHGMSADEPAPLMADYIARHVHPDDRDPAFDSFKQLLRRHDGLLDMDFRIVRADGQVRRLSTRSSISGDEGQRHLHGVMFDVTERHATAERLRQAHERAALAARGAGIGTWESDADASQGWWDEQMFHLRGREPRTTPVPVAEMLQWLHPDDRERHVRRLQAALVEDRPSNQEFRVVWPDGSVRWLASRSTPVRDEHGRTVRRIGINWDITDARNAAAAREGRLLAQRESQAKSRLLARVSHELRTPLNAVLGFSQLLLTETAPGSAPDPATWRRRVEHVQASGEHLLALIDDVLELSSLDSGELPLTLQPVAIAPLAESCLPQVELLAGEHGVTVELGALDGWALADPVRLRQVLLNLLSNAIKYNRRGGRATVGSAVDGEHLLLRVQDTGRGLDEQQLRHLFEPFNRLGAEREGIAGTGIGLAIVQASMRQMGGTVAVDSRPGEGSCFALRLRRAQPPQAPLRPAEQPLPASLPPLPPLLSGRRLLYIEDNEVNLMIVGELMRQRSDLEFRFATDGAAGLALARAELPALILLDLQLPDVDGHEVLRQLRADPTTADIRCIAVSANAMPEDMRRARDAGFDGYWTKPLDLGAFLRSLDELFGSATS